MGVPLDELDLRILQELQRDSSRTNVQLARTVGLSAPACLRRVQRLRRSGAIRCEVALLDPRVAGLHTAVLVALTVERESKELVAALKQRLLAEEAVEQCWYVTGRFDLVVLVRVADMRAYEALVQRLFSSDPNIRRSESLVVLEEVKRELRIPLAFASSR
ncbi:MAG TPA: Lrp/AsnC family transcriptional regulator [Myxococcales bacterium]|nr:Lrp/AsnC family transcriptional regulator [Myxococcales bacterium]